MESMDLKGIAWVGNIYQKFEAMCLEVEEAMCQETTKYVENQVQTVGAGMKKLCSEVMQDLLPPSSKDLSRVASADLLLNPYLEFGIHKKPVSNVKEDAINVNISKDKSKSSNDLWDDWAAASFDWEISDKDEEDCDLMVRKASNENTVTPVCTKSSANVVKRSRRISSTNIVRADRADTRGSSELVTQVGPQATSNTLSTSESVDRNVSHPDFCENSRPTTLSSMDANVTDSNVSANIQCDQSVGDEVFRPHTGITAACDPDLGDETTKIDSSLQILEPIRHEFESEFEKTCVLVDGNDCLSDNHKDERRPSYKKKIQNAFSMKKKSATKQEYKQVAAKHLATQDSLESGWELL